MGYFHEFRAHWPNLLGAALGLGFGTAINHYMLNLFGPALIAEFGWSKSQFALVGSLALISLFFTPVAGRIVDRYGPRKAAMIGFAVVPPAFFAMSLMTGNILQFYAITLVTSTLGILTATMTFTRVVVERFDRARGIALSCMLSCPPLIGAIAAPVIGAIIEDQGWRTAYRVLALLSAAGGIAAITLVGRTSGKPVAKMPIPQLSKAEFRGILKNPMFLLLIGGMFACNVPQPLVSSQMTIMLMESHASMAFASALVSVYAITVVIGRFISGYALDRVPPHFVAIVALGLPAIGYVGIASSYDARWVLAGAIGLVGLAQGAETDVGAFLTSRKFDMNHYSFVFAMLMTSMGLASALGSILLSLTLRNGGTFNAFLLVSAAATLGGALCFYLTGRHNQDEPEATLPAHVVISGDVA